MNSWSASVFIDLNTIEEIGYAEIYYTVLKDGVLFDGGFDVPFIEYNPNMNLVDLVITAYDIENMQMVEVPLDVVIAERRILAVPTCEWKATLVVDLDEGVPELTWVVLKNDEIFNGTIERPFVEYNPQVTMEKHYVTVFDTDSMQMVQVPLTITVDD